jgi:hypothetical protein
MVKAKKPVVKTKKPAVNTEVINEATPLVKGKTREGEHEVATLRNKAVTHTVMTRDATLAQRVQAINDKEEETLREAGCSKKALKSKASNDPVWDCTVKTVPYPDRRDWFTNLKQIKKVDVMADRAMSAFFREASTAWKKWGRTELSTPEFFNLLHAIWIEAFRTYTEKSTFKLEPKTRKNPSRERHYPSQNKKWLLSNGDAAYLIDVNNEGWVVVKNAKGVLSIKSFYYHDRTQIISEIVSEVETVNGVQSIPEKQRITLDDATKITAEMMSTLRYRKGPSRVAFEKKLLEEVCREFMIWDFDNF